MGKKQERDFQKVKRKGHGKAPAARSAVVSSFRTRALAMPYQKMADTARLARDHGACDRSFSCLFG
jgi:hypothetical protein